VSGDGPLHVAVGVPSVREFADPRLLVDLAVAAEEAGWDGFFVWDHLLYRQPDPAVADPQVVISAVAARTSRMRLGILIVPLSRRRPAKVAKEMATLDHLTGGRMVLGAGLGSYAPEWSELGEDPAPKVRAARLDEGLEIVAGLLAGEEVTVEGEHEAARGARIHPPSLQRPRVPIWIGGSWPNRRPFERAARWDGVMPTHVDYGSGTTMPPSELAAALAHVDAHRADPSAPFDVALEGATPDDAEEAAQRIAPYREVGLTWWVEALGWWRGDVRAARTRIDSGPPARLS
jgi:alkanesulfonate monooxygenase SsuD/methylene tetrahydromethanopterin reductase-like flavin-dependent oxidoreductase (luciferase family)